MKERDYIKGIILAFIIAIIVWGLLKILWHKTYYAPCKGIQIEEVSVDFPEKIFRSRKGVRIFVNESGRIVDVTGMVVSPNEEVIVAASFDSDVQFEGVFKAQAFLNKTQTVTVYILSFKETVKNGKKQYCLLLRNLSAPALIVASMTHKHGVEYTELALVLNEALILKISGRIVDEQGIPLSNTEVKVYYGGNISGEYEEEYLFSVKTTECGEFYIRLSNVSWPPYTVLLPPAADKIILKIPEKDINVTLNRTQLPEFLTIKTKG